MSWLSELLDLWRHHKPPDPVDPPPDNTSAALLAGFNGERARAGLTALLANASLTSAAQGWADEMARKGVLTHGDFTGRIARVGYSFVYAGEVIAQGQQTTAEVVSDWMRSPGHRAQILGPYKHVGFGRHGDYWCADLAAPLREGFIAPLLARPMRDGSDSPRRSPGWGKARALHLLRFPTCEACGGKEDLAVHHVHPWHLFPELELEQSNLMTLCAPHHLFVAHLMDWSAWNPDVRRHAAMFRDLIARRTYDR